MAEEARVQYRSWDKDKHLGQRKTPRADMRERRRKVTGEKKRTDREKTEKVVGRTWRRNQVKETSQSFWYRRFRRTLCPHCSISHSLLLLDPRRRKRSISNLPQTLEYLAARKGKSAATPGEKRKAIEERDKWTELTFQVPSRAAAPVAGLSMIDNYHRSQPFFRFGVSKDAKPVESFTKAPTLGSKATSSSNEATSAFQFGRTSLSEFSFKFSLDETTKTEVQKVSLADNVSPPCLDVSHLGISDLFATSESTESKVQTVRYGPSSRSLWIARCIRSFHCRYRFKRRNSIGRQF
ncbi:hypothetical protein C8J56DRAFT_1063941 [Mycena floridula]|nr:hypothetical protein C8J56DRAFT_1063941 [Mycena floridula]